MSEAVNYIKDLQDRIRNLGDKKDQLKRVTKLEDNESTEEKCLPLENVTVTRCWPGVEIVVKTGSNQGFRLRNVLEVLGDENQGLNVIDCVSTKVEDRFIHTIKSEVG